MSAARHPDWHWPHFAQALCGELSDRQRLGLPDRFVAGRFETVLAARHDALRHASVDAWLETLSSAAAPLVDRLVSGNLLAMAGDPRIAVEQPAMVDIAGGEVEVGLPATEVRAVIDRFDGLGLERAWIEKECPRHRVVLAAYRIARHPVTNTEYRAFLLDTGHAELPSSWHFRQFPQARANHPVYTVSAASADVYARWLAACTGRPFRLPTEAEWEWAASGPGGREFPWGERFDADLANTAETGLFTTSAVGAFVGGESAFGVSDLAGNVEEYVADDYAAYPGGQPVEDNLVQIHGGHPGRYRVARGGSFARFRDLARTRRRHGHNPRSATYAMGFRLAESVA